MKKFLLSIAAVVFSNALPLSYNLDNWSLAIPKSTTQAGIIYLPMEVNYELLQNTLNSDNNLTVYTIATSSKYVEALIGKRILPKVLITKDGVKYELISYDDNGNKQINYFDTFKEFNSTIADMDIPTNKTWFINSYIGYLNEIHKNGVYYIKAPQGFDFSIGFNYGTINSGTSGTGSDYSSLNGNNDLQTPPTPPTVTNNGDEQNNNALETPPTPPSLED